MLLFEGVGVALLTIFNADLSIDTGASAHLAEVLVQHEVAGVIVAGTTGEAFSLDRQERIALIKAVKASVDVPVIAGTGAPSIWQAEMLTKDAHQAGADGMLALTPAGTADPRPYYSALRQAAETRWLGGYHFPAISGPGIDLEVLDELDIDACKDSTGDAGRLLAQVTTHATPIYPGSSALVLMAGQLGSPGVILAAANAAPDLCVRAFEGDVEAFKEMAPIHAATSRRHPHGIKAVAAERFGIADFVRIA